MGDADAPCRLLLRVGDIGSKVLAERWAGEGCWRSQQGRRGTAKDREWGFLAGGPPLACGCPEAWV